MPERRQLDASLAYCAAALAHADDSRLAGLVTFVHKRQHSDVPMFDPVAICTKTLEIVELCPAAGLHIGNRYGEAGSVKRIAQLVSDGVAQTCAASKSR